MFSSFLHKTKSFYSSNTHAKTLKKEDLFKSVTYIHSDLHSIHENIHSNRAQNGCIPGFFEFHRSLSLENLQYSSNMWIINLAN